MTDQHGSEFSKMLPVMQQIKASLFRSVQCSNILLRTGSTTD
ncbi:hypothetical protein SynA1560_02139 [Synechococcus sp. A15-60]|nr:hypothetical protein SynA1560_02139 [Synechococcus sp. A15-60]